MNTKIVEATNGANWGKFLIGWFDLVEWARHSAILPGDDDLSQHSLLSLGGWSPEHFLLLDLDTGEGGLFRHRGLADQDLAKKHVSVGPMCEPFLDWLYNQPLDDVRSLNLPKVVTLANDRPASGRRAGEGE
jgi:hypothetical protein